MAIAEGIGEDIGNTRVHRVIVAAVSGQILVHGPGPKHQRQVVPISDDLKKSYSE